MFAICTQGFRFAEHDAEDVFQDVFARVYTHLDRLRDDEAFRPWLAQLTRRACIDKLRAGSRESPVEELEPTELDETLSQLDEALSVHEAMATLPENCREILDRFFARDESYRTIGDALDLPAGHDREPIVTLSRQVEDAAWKKTRHRTVLRSGDSMNASDHDKLGQADRSPPSRSGWVGAGSAGAAGGPQGNRRHRRAGRSGCRLP